MIHEIGIELQAYLTAKRCPFKVVDGPESTTTTTYARERVVLERDETGDRFGPPRGQRRNERQVLTRAIGCKATIYAQSGKSGATQWEHNRRADAVADLVAVGLREITKIRKSAVAFSGGKLVPPDDLEESEVAGGAVYELTFSVDRAVTDRNWEREAAPELQITAESPAIKSTTKVGRANGPNDDGDPYTVPPDAETACGQ